LANLKIEEVEGIGSAFGEKLRGAGVADTDTLLDRACSKKGRQELAAASGIPETKLLKWVNAADLCRISGVGPEYAELLEAAGVDTVVELRTRNADNLAAKCDEVNQSKKLTRRVPTASVIADWIDQAKRLEPKVTH
jgi:predicted flap endonuclease-1-like 5' DNA nuclease